MITPPLHDPAAIRKASRDLLSLALIDARNVTLRWVAAFEAAGFDEPPPGFEAPYWLAGQAAWLQERWIARNVQRGRGRACDPSRPPLASIDPLADPLYVGGEGIVPPPDDLRPWLAQTLETTLELLDATAEDDSGLYFFRLALWHEDRLAERFAAIAQAAGMDTAHQRALWPEALPVRSPRPPLVFATQRCTLGAGATPGFVPDEETGEEGVVVPEFEIDAQPVTWAQYGEFVEDGGYDEPRWWSEAGWEWLQREGRRAPRHVEQLRNGVLLQRAGAVQRAQPHQAAVHVSALEAEAWCRWAGRRLPAEPEWALMAAQGRSRGAAWGEVNEWVLGGARLFDEASRGPVAWQELLQPEPPGEPRLRVLRGASWLTAPRRAHPHARRFVRAEDDAMFSGFRSCAI